MKKFKVVLYIVLCAMLMIQLSGCDQNDKDAVSYPRIYDYLNSITLDTFNKKISNDKFFIIYVARPSCLDCELLDERIINDITKYDGLKKILYLSIAPIHNDKEKWKEFKNKYQLEGTPTFIAFKNGETRDMYGWTKKDGFDYERFITWINEMEGLGVDL